MVDYLRVDAEPKYIQIISEPYVIFTSRGYQPVVDVVERKSKTSTRLFITARSLAERLEILRQDNGGNFSGLEFWLRKESYKKTAPYILELG